MQEARREHSTAEEYLRRLLSEHLWRRRMEQARLDMAEPDQEYRDLTAEWDSIGDGPG